MLVKPAGAATVPTVAARRSVNVPLLILIGVAATIGWLVLPPLFFIVRTSLQPDRGAGGFTLEHYADVLGSLTGNPILLTNSLLFAVGSSVLAVALGTTTAWLTERTSTPLRRMAYVAAFASIATPGIVKVIGWILLLGPRAGLINTWLRDAFGLIEPPFNLFTVGGMILVEGLLWTPIVFLLMAMAFRGLNPALEEAARVSGATISQTIWKVSLPIALPSLLAVLLLTLARSLEAFEIPALIGIPAGVPVLTTEIYLGTRGYLPRYGEASANAVVLIVLVTAALYPYFRLTRSSRSFASIVGRGFRPGSLDLGRGRLLATPVLLVLPGLLVLPLLALLWASLLPFLQPPSEAALGSLSLGNYSAAFSDPNLGLAVRNSLVVSTSTATGTVGLTLLAAWLVVRTRFRVRWLLDLLATLPLVFPGIVLGIAVLQTYLALPLPIYGSLGILIVAFTARYLPYGMRSSHAGLLAIHPGLEDAARVCGASWWQTMRRVVIPLMAPTLFAAWVYVAMISYRELSVALLLYGPGTQVVGVMIWELWDSGHVGQLSAFSLLITGALLVLALPLQRLGRLRGFHS